MSGLNLGAGAQVRGQAQATYGNPSNPKTATEAGFGIGEKTDSGGGLAGFLIPNDTAGLVFWVGVLATAGLIFLYTSLPG